MQKLRLIVLAAIAVLILIIVLQNRQQVEIRMLFTTVSMSQAVSLFATLAIGFALGMLVAIRLARKPKKD